MIEDALALLGSLGDADRRWILDNLPTAAKARLLAGTGGRDPRSRVAACDAATVLEALSAEPAWLIQAVLAADHWPWKEAVLGQLPGHPARRGGTLARPALEFLLQTLSRRLAKPAVDTVQFDSLVSNFSRRTGQ